MYCDYENKRSFSKQDKAYILNQLNEQRLLRQKIEERQKNRFKNKKVYTIHSEQYYKITDSQRDYYVTVDECTNITYKPSLITLYTYSYTIMSKEEGLIKVDWATDRLLVSNDITRVYFKPFYLETEDASA